MLRAQLLVATVLLPVLSALRANRTLWSVAGGEWLDRFGPRRTIAAGWLVHAAAANESAGLTTQLERV